MSAVMIATVTSVMSLIGTLVVGWFVFKASNNASERTAAVQKEANDTIRFDRLTERQAQQLEVADERLARAEQVAAVAGQRAEEAIDRSEEAMRTAEQFELRLTQLIVSTRDLHRWASQPCPHPMPPPPLPTWFPYDA